MRKVLQLAALAGTVGASTLALSSPAAAANPYTAQEVCGSSYYYLNSQTLDGSKVTVMYNSSGYNCVATIKTKDIGISTKTGAGVWVQGESSGRLDSANYKYYAVSKAYAADKCIRWTGGTNRDWTYFSGSNWSWSAWEFCS